MCVAVSVHYELCSCHVCRHMQHVVSTCVHVCGCRYEYCNTMYIRSTCHVCTHTHTRYTCTYLVCIINIFLILIIINIVIIVIIVIIIIDDSYGIYHLHARMKMYTVHMMLSVCCTCV